MTFDTTKLTQARETMQDICNKRAADLGKIRADMEKVNADIAQYEAAMGVATENMDTKAYAAAKSKLETAKTTAEMYAKRYDAIRTNEMITEADSDAVIDSIFAFEREATALYKDKAVQLVQELDELTNEYRAVINDAERFMQSWAANVHENYRSNIGGKAIRRNKPQRIRVLPYLGCDLSDITKKFVDTFNRNADK